MAASDSSARSASTLRISGWSTSGVPNALRWRTWSTASVSARASAPPSPARSRAGSSATISMMVAHAPALLADPPADRAVVFDLGEALDRLPSLSLSRWMWMPLRVPSGSIRGTRKQVQPSGRLGEHEEHVVHGRRAEPFVAGEPVCAVAGGLGARWCSPARPSRPASRSSTCPRSARASSRAGAGRSYSGGGSGSYARPAPARAQRRDRRVRHRDRAAVPGLGLRDRLNAGRPRHVRAGPGLSPTPPRAAVATARASASARRGGTRPRRCGCRSGRGCAAPAGGRWRAGRAPALPPT